MKKQQIFILALIISLIVNIFFGGILLGKHLYGKHPDMHLPPPMKIRPIHLQRLLDELPPEKADIVRPIITEHVSAFRSHFRKMRQNRRAVHEQLSAEKVDKVALEQALNTMENNMQHIRTIMHKTLVDVAINLDKSEREELIKAILHRPPRHHKPPHHHGERHERPHFSDRHD